MYQLSEKTIRTKTIYEGKVITLKVKYVTLPNGETAKRECVKHPGAVAIIPITKDKKIIFAEQYRKPLEKALIEIPAGKMEAGEKPEVTAIRELEEETGYTTDHLTYVDSFYTSPGFADEFMHIYLTTDLQPLKVKVEGDEDEFINIIELTLNEAVEMMKQQKIQDAKTNYALLYLQASGQLKC